MSDPMHAVLIFAFGSILTIPGFAGQAETPQNKPTEKPAEAMAVKPVTR